MVVMVRFLVPLQTRGTHYRPDLENAALVRWSKVGKNVAIDSCARQKQFDLSLISLGVSSILICTLELRDIVL